MVKFNKAARDSYLEFSRSLDATWSANFRDLNASVTRMATLSEGGRITKELVEEEIARLKSKWQKHPDKHSEISLTNFLDTKSISQMDLYDQVALSSVIQTCQESKSMAEAGRKLFNVSRTTKSSNNDSHRVKQILRKYGLSFEDIKDKRFGKRLS